MEEEQGLELYTDKFKELFAKKYRATKSGCWLWTASRDKDDYGQVRVGSTVKRAHRVAWELANNQVIPPDMDIDHTCHIRRCVFPDHLDLVTHAENMKNLRKKDDWEIPDASETSNEKKTTSELVIDEAVAIIERSGVEIPPRNSYGINVSLSEPEWRDIPIERGYVPQVPMSRVKLFLDAVRLGANWKVAADRILNVSPFTVEAWRDKNLLFAEDYLAAKKQGRKTRYTGLEDTHLDELERKIEFADFKDIAASLKNLRDQDDERQAAKKGGDGMPNITIIFGNNPKALETLVEIAEEIEGEFTVIEPKTLKEG